MKRTVILFLAVCLVLINVDCSLARARSSSSSSSRSSSSSISSRRSSTGSVSSKSPARRPSIPLRSPSKPVIMAPIRKSHPKVIVPPSMITTRPHTIRTSGTTTRRTTTTSRPFSRHARCTKSKFTSAFCKTHGPRHYYDRTTNTCVPFSGCAHPHPTENLFDSLQECSRLCVGRGI